MSKWSLAGVLSFLVSCCRALFSSPPSSLQLVLSSSSEGHFLEENKFHPNQLDYDESLCSLVSFHDQEKERKKSDKNRGRKEGSKSALSFTHYSLTRSPPKNEEGNEIKAVEKSAPEAGVVSFFFLYSSRTFGQLLTVYFHFFVWKRKSQQQEPPPL